MQPRSHPLLTGELDLQKMLATLQPRLRDPEYVFVCVDRATAAAHAATATTLAYPRVPVVRQPPHAVSRARSVPRMVCDGPGRR